MVDAPGGAVGDRGEIKTFLIADIRGYTSFTQERGDVAAGTLATRFAAITRSVVEAQSGRLLELRGDEALVVFDSARRAISAAIGLQARFVEETEADPSLPLAVGIGLDAGEAVRVEGGYRGAALNRAARLCGIAAPGEVLASREVVHLAGRVAEVALTDRGGLELKGLAKAVNVIEVVSETAPAPPRMAPFAPPAQRGPSPPGGGIRFCVLGPLEVFADGGADGTSSAGQRLSELGPPKQRAILAILILHAGEIVPADRLIELVWGDHPPRTAAHSVQVYVSDLRKTLDPVAGRPVILTRPPGYLLEAAPDFIDARQFERLVQDGARVVKAGDRAGGAAALRRALRLWRGQPLSDFAYEEFAQAHTRRLQELRLTAIEGLAAAELAEGQAREVLPLLEAAISEEPLRDGLRELQILALYRSGRHPDALRAYQDFHRLLADELGLDPSPSLQQLQERILLHDPSLLPERADTATGAPVRNPYKGLLPFAEEDAGDFFGREALVRQFLDSLAKGTPLLAAVGPSGSGKSSVVAAGLIPAVRSGAIEGSDGWVIVRMQPGTDPFEELWAALPPELLPPPAVGGHPDEGAASPVAASLRSLPVGGRLVMVIDQFEELFTLADEESRDRFLDDIASAVTAPRSPLQVVICLRGDFYDRPLLHPGFARVFVPGVVNILPMTPAEIEEAVVEPARRAGVEVEPALLAQVIADTAHQPGALPLLQYALTELFNQRSGDSLTLEAYRSIGGLHGALSRRSEEVFGHLDAERQEIAVQLFLRLIRWQEEARPVRRRLPISDLTALDLDPVALSDVLEKFGSHRLTSFDRDPLTGRATVEVAHEALLSEWERLAGWIESHRDDLKRYEALASAADEWEAAGRNPDFLLTGSRLADAEAWAGRTALRLTTNERTFLEAGVERRRAREAEEAALTQRQRRLERRARTRLVALAAAIVLAAGAVTYAILAPSGDRPPDAVLLIARFGQQVIDDMLVAGFKEAAADFDVRAESTIVSGDRVVSETRRLSEDGVDLLIPGAFGDICTELGRIAAEHPDSNYVVFDCGVEKRNIAYGVFATEEGSFLAGAAAALESRTGVVGFLGGVDIPLIWPFHAGFEAGARAAVPTIEVRATYLSKPPDFTGFDDEVGAFQAAEKMYSGGADVIYHAAGRSGNGLFEAAFTLSEGLGRHLWAIGVDADQYRTLDPGDEWRTHILTSMVKRYDRAVYTALEEYARGTFAPGRRVLDLAAGGVDVAYSGGFIDDLRPQLERLRERVIAGEIEVPSIPCSRAQFAERSGLTPPESCP